MNQNLDLTTDNGVQTDAPDLALRPTEEIVSDTGLKANSGFGVRQPLWGNVGIVLSEEERPTNWADARRLAGLDWDPQEEPTFRQRISIENGQPVERFAEISNYKFIVRPDTNDILAQVNSTYNMITISDMGMVMGAYLGKEKLRFETAGVLHNGRKVWALLEYGDPIQLAGDPSPTKRYLAILNSFDGSSALRVISTLIRVECYNSWKAADLDGNASGACHSFHHSSGWKARLEDATREVDRSLTSAHSQADAYVKIAQDLLNRPVTAEQEQRFCEEFIRPTKLDWKLKPKALENVNARRDELLALIRTSPTCAPIRRSAYRLVQGAGEYLDHIRGTQRGGRDGDESRLDRAVFTPSDLKRRARTFAELAANKEL